MKFPGDDMASSTFLPTTLLATVPESSAIEVESIALSEIIQHASTSGIITAVERYHVMLAFVQDSLTDAELYEIECLLRAVCQGKIRVVDSAAELTESLPHSLSFFPAIRKWLRKRFPLGE